MELSKEPLVSITTPTFNRPDYLKQAITSALNQTYQNFEIIVSDNASPESAQELVASFKDPRIRFHRYEKAVSMLENHMGGFKMARGKYVASLHDDDIWEQDYLNKMVWPLEQNPDLIVTFCSQWVIDEHGAVSQARTHKYNTRLGRHKLVQKVYQPFMDVALKDLAIQPASSAVIRRDGIAWDRIPAQVGPMWDVYVSYLLAKTGKAAFFINEKLTRYRIHSQSDTGSYENLPQKMKRAINQMDCYGLILSENEKESVLDDKVYAHVKGRWQHASTTMAIALLKENKSQVSQARQYLYKALKQGKLSARTWAAFGISLLPGYSRKLILDLAVKAKATGNRPV